MNDKIKTQITGSIATLLAVGADAEYIAEAVLHTLQPVLVEGQRFRLLAYCATHPESPEAQMMDQISEDLENGPDLTAEQQLIALVQMLDAVREKFGDRP